MFKSLRDRFRRAGKQAEAEIEPQLDLSYEAYRPEEREKGAVVQEKHLENVMWELELALLESDVAMEAVEALKAKLRERLVGLRVASRGEIAPTIEKALKASLVELLSLESFDPQRLLARADGPLVIAFVGVNGTGKTTTIARLAHWLQAQGRSVVLAAADTFRAGAIEQLEIHANKLGCKFIAHQAGGDPAAVAFDAVAHARAKHRDVVLIDTAGRMQTNTNLMDEMAKIQRVAKPDMVMFVGDALAGNDAVEQARKFHATVGIDAVILTKLDVDAKGGAALSIASAIGRPIAFVGIGQDYEDLMPFDAAWIVERIFAA
ncbi:MAG: signal recognition particle-docking protein FtsY [Euryarchaeota archaeon]|jgi:fused signal recognition particle receptor|nr:signal recognition particle-docking protein FtsY [Euryarchaeota archaeon]MDP6364045.1 signal recognition particle-docking protein FtsY [Candidatus Poseidoniia archaeon]MDP6658750.1 signal recognition particle-docking protein FtsY [Candidatus Poseidoniia archaeon]MDP6846624.1 signal recognition particle-docking protein FtsY [Candidatus Poseidoniia archaeon]MDP7006893.1 signal recognition particle-docking protein FtsY [Candidatus Poseidoniia archaeon]|tara:strand:+ start:3742 stop:4701 length:960 start_codon:yes stop_codon:yes gene_type:complete